MNVDVGAEPGVVGEVPAVVVGIFVDDDVIAVPKPIANVIVIVGSYAEGEAAEPEALAVSTAQAEHMTAAKAAGEAAMFPRMIEMIVGIIAAGIVADPCVIVVDVRSFRVIGLIAEGRARIFLGAGFGSAIFRTVRRGISGGCWAVRGNVTAADVASTAALLALVLRTGAVGEKECGSAQREDQDQHGEKVLHFILRK